MSKPIKKTDENKPWNRRKTFKKAYNFNQEVAHRAFLIICEGENTEPEYFKAIPAENTSIKIIGLGSSRTTLVECAFNISQEEDYQGMEVWCVFDMDYKGDNANIKADFNEAVELAKKYDFYTAYSNDAFELWLVLHYKIIEGEFLRFDYYRMLSELWDVNYEKTSKKLSFCKTIYERLEKDDRASQNVAIERAKKLYEDQSDLAYCDQNPCTKVFILVEKILNSPIDSEDHNE